MPGADAHAARPPDALLPAQQTTGGEGLAQVLVDPQRGRTAAPSSASALAPTQAEPEISIHIGRIDLRTAAPASAPRKPRHKQANPASLADYLNGKPS